MDVSQDIVDLARQWRHDLHRHPELAFEEHRTSAFVAKMLAEYGYEVRGGYAGTGVVGTLLRGTSSRVIALRADMDALPLTEQTGAPYASLTPGVMHACGHDGHVAMLLAAAKIAAARTDLDGTVHFIFQPAEEIFGGARKMMDDGLFRDIAPDDIYALHNWPGLAPGKLVARDGAMMAAFATFDIKIIGRGAHGAMPHEGADPIATTGQLITALQSITARNVSPLQSSVVSVTQMSGGDTYNVIPETVSLRGTTRWFDHSVGDLIERRLSQVAQRICEAYDCRAEVVYERRYPATINDTACAAISRRAAAAIGLDVVEADPSMAAEDFASMLEERKGAYLWLGSQREGSNPGLHAPQFDFNDAILSDGIRLWTGLLTQELARG